MKIYKLLFVFFFIINGCGIKAPPIPKDSLNIPYPTDVNVSITNDGVLISNNQDIMLVVEKSKIDNNALNRRYYKRLTLISPKNTYIDEEVVDGTTYTYRFKNYSTEYNTFSTPAVRTITYNTPIKIKDVKIEQKNNSVCLNIKLNETTKYADIMINSKVVSKINKNGESCYNLPLSAQVSIIILPYDKNENAGIPYETTITQNNKDFILPPQNVKALRETSSVVLSWDKVDNAESYNIYINNENIPQLIDNTTITLYKYNLKNNENCIDFLLSTVKGRKESNKIQVTSCP